jgi:hypothetical protein
MAEFKCANQNCNNLAVASLFNDKTTKTATLSDLVESVERTYTHYCGYHANRAKPFYGWKFIRKVDEFDPAHDVLLIPEQSETHQTPENKNPNPYPDDEMTVLMNVVQKTSEPGYKKKIYVPSHLQGEKLGNLIAVRDGATETKMTILGFKNDND